MLKIGELAKRCQVSVGTLRFYEKNGLLNSDSRTDTGYRLFSEEAERRLDFILRAKQVGLSLQDISELLAIRIDPNNHSCGDVKQVIDNKLKQINNKITELQRFKAGLQQLSNNCCGATISAEHCSILGTLNHSDMEKQHKDN